MTRTLLALVFVLAAGPARADTPAKKYPLWPNGAPGAKGKEPADVPSVTVYLPPADRATGAAVVICPGGGYGFLAMDHEGHQVARWLNTLGVAGVILQYRIAPRYHYPAPLQDAQRALRFTRAHAKAWRLDPRRVGILGFSAGGHLASTVATHFADSRSEVADRIDGLSCRPDFAVLVYPVITFQGPHAHGGSRNNLLGKEAKNARLIEDLSNDRQVTSKTPPTFLVHTSEDTGVPPENSVLFYLACRKAGVPAELHVFEKGQHGLGLGPRGSAFAAWPGLCAAWLRERGLLPKGVSQPRQQGQ